MGVNESICSIHLGKFIEMLLIKFIHEHGPEGRIGKVIVITASTLTVRHEVTFDERDTKVTF